MPLKSFTITGSFPVLSVIGTLRYFMSDSLLRKLIDTTAVLYFSAFALVRGLYLYRSSVRRVRLGD